MLNSTSFITTLKQLAHCNEGDNGDSGSSNNTDRSTVGRER